MHPAIGLAVIALPCLLYSMDLTVLNLALPALAAELQPSSTQQLWIVDIYGFLVAGLLTGAALLLVPPALTLFDGEVRRARATRLWYDIATALLWLGFVVGGLTVPDSGDSGPLDTALMVWFGISAETSAALFAVAAALIGLSYLAALVTAIRGIARARRVAAS